MEKDTAKKTKSSRSAKTPAQEVVYEEEVKSVSKPVVKKIDPDQIVRVINGFQGELVYRSRKTGELYKWSEFGDDQDMELSELKSARSSSKKFFENNWFMFDEDWIVDYLGMKKYYKHAIKVEDFDELFEKSSDEITEIVSAMSAGQRKSVAYRARQLIDEEVIDSIKKIDALEKCLNTKLVER